MNIFDKLTNLEAMVDALNAICEAIYVRDEKTVTNMTDLPATILRLSRSQLDWESIGYKAEPEFMSESYAQSKELKDAFEAGTITANNLCRNYRGIKFLPELDLTRTTDASGMCKNANGLIIMHPELDFSNVQNAAEMFAYCTSLTTLDRYVTDSEGNIQYDGNGNPLMESRTFSSLTNCQSMLRDCFLLKELDMSNWDLSQVTNFTYAFSGVRNVSVIDFAGSHIEENQVCTSMQRAFLGDQYTRSILTTISFPKDENNNELPWDLSNCTSMYETFCYLSSLRNIPTLILSKITDMRATFLYNRFTEIDASNWDTQHLTAITAAFQHCTSLTTIITKADNDIDEIGLNLSSIVNVIPQYGATQTGQPIPMSLNCPRLTHVCIYGLKIGIRFNTYSGATYGDLDGQSAYYLLAKVHTDGCVDSASKIYFRSSYISRINDYVALMINDTTIVGSRANRDKILWEYSYTDNNESVVTVSYLVKNEDNSYATDSDGNYIPDTTTYPDTPGTSGTAYGYAKFLVDYVTSKGFVVTFS